MSNSHLLFQSLFKKELSSDDSKKFLTDLTKEHPYFTAAHFYLLKETALENTNFETQAATTALLFNNDFWLNYQLNNSFADDTANNQLLEERLRNQEILIEQKINIPGEQPTEELADVHVEQENLSAKIEVPIIEPVQERIEATEFKEESSDEDNLPKFVFIKEDEQGMKDITEEDFEEEIDDRELEPMNIKLNFTNINTTEDTISFEPLHVSDYFTSVGIKVSNDVKPGDKLGKQLKSFTDWLKTMKKIHVEHLQEEIAENNDIIIQQMAEKSNKEGETLTEAMAEVLLQQGMRVKATEVYQKLSLLNPVKSAYFAAKIDQINR